jgi:NADH-quinone oxidoreductase subunit G
MNELVLLKEANIIGIGSARASLESNFALRKIVGETNFYHGLSSQENHLTNLILEILSCGIRFVTMKEVEKSDAVFVLGEDLTNTAPMLALAVRQASRQQPLKKVAKERIPEWNDAAARELIQEEKSPVFIASVCATKLDDIATSSWHAAPDDVARLGFAVAHRIDERTSSVQHLSNQEKELVESIASALLAAERPVIISGTSTGSEAIIKAAESVAWALHQRNKGGVMFTFPECNSLGLALMDGDSFENIKEEADALIILESDLYRHAIQSKVDKLFRLFRHIIVIDHTQSKTTKKATLLIPSGTLAESEGTIVNNEGRAQRYFQVYEPTNGLQESWHWLIQIGKAMNKGDVASWKDHDDITRALAAEQNTFTGIDKISPPSDFRINGQKIPRQPHRYSGRTAMLANVNVSEPKPPEDFDSALTYTMEGTRVTPPSSMIPYFWSPGWNSVQSVNKYQEEIGGHLRGGDPGRRLINSDSDDDEAVFFTDVPGAFIPREGEWLIVPMHHIFGSEELSALAPAIAERSAKPYIGLNEQESIAIGKKEGDVIDLRIDGQQYNLPVKIISSLPKGVAGMPVGLREMPFCRLPEWGSLT